MRGLAIGVGLLLAVLPCPPAGGEADAERLSLDRLTWLAGCWGSSDADGTSEECWLAPRAGLMLGVHRDVSPSGKAFFEFLRIESSETGVVYLASPKGSPPTPFALVSLEGTSVVFENREHDFPQRLHYRLLDDGPLRVRAEGSTEGDEKILEWVWKRHPKTDCDW